MEGESIQVTPMPEELLQLMAAGKGVRKTGGERHVPASGLYTHAHTGSTSTKWFEK